jgi:hypothetical protein
MQLNPADPARPAAGEMSLRLALAAAAGALLAPVPAQAQDEQPGLRAPWRVDGAVLLYSEADGRVRAVEPVVAVRRTDARDRSLSLKLTLDSLTGASPNGAVPQPVAQTFTTPSGRATYETPPGQIPLDPTFKDTRIALNAGWEQPWRQDSRVQVGGNVSTEHDFVSASVNAALSHDYNQKNTTASLGLSLEFDTIKPEGGVPLGLTPAFVQPQKVASDKRTVVDVLAGVTQVMSRRWLMQVNYSLGRSSGYHTDPYKLLSVVDGASGLVTGDSYVAEFRPDTRTRQSIFWQNKLHLERGDVVDLAYRYYTDDWGIKAHTLDARYRWQWSERYYLEPHLRAYRQDAAEFYRTFLVEGVDYDSAADRAGVGFASADPRLAGFSAMTVGLKLGVALPGQRELSVRLESYNQKIDQPANAPGALQGLDLTPDLKAVTLMVGYSLDF